MMQTTCLSDQCVNILLSAQARTVVLVTTNLYSFKMRKNMRLSIPVLPFTFLGCMLLLQARLKSTSAFVPSSSSLSGSSPLTPIRPFTCASTRLFESPEPLASEGDWAAYLDLETYGVIYYFNTKTGESRWEPPTDTFPSVYLKPSVRRKADAKKEEYYKSMAKTEEKKENFVTKLLDSRKEQTEQPQEEEEPQWMKGLLEEKFPNQEEEKPGLFSRFLNANKPKSDDKATSTSAVEPAPAPTPSLVASKDKPTKNIFDNIFASMTSDADAPTSKSEPFFVESTGESEKAKAAKTAEEERVEKERRSAEAKAEAERKRQEAEEEKAQEAKMKAQAEADRKQAERVRKAEAEQKAEADRLEAEARKTIEKSKEAEEARKAEQKAKRAEQAAKLAESAKPGATINLFGLEIPVGIDIPVKSAPKQKSVEEEKIIVEETQAPIKIDMSSFVLPHPSKVMWGGEDAVFTKGRTFGVFDGVSGADKMDGLPLYSKMLARQMTQSVDSGKDLTIKDLQEQLLAAAEIADERATGASTAIVASITEDGFLRAINLGDSVCIVVRGDKIVARTKEIVHYFDCPYQLSEISPDRPRDARKLNFELVRGDVVLMASDGVFDNLMDSEIIEIVNSYDKANSIAKTVSDRSRKISLNSKATTPYSKAAKRNGDPDYKDGLGGKVDDISCVVARYV